MRHQHRNRRKSSDAAIKFYVRAMDICSKGIQLDVKGSYEDAVKIYTNAIEYFIAGIRRDSSKKRRAHIKQKVGEFLRRAETIKSALLRAKEDVRSRRRVSHGGGELSAAVSARVREIFANASAGVPEIKWDDVAGVDAAKSALEEAIILPSRFPCIFKDGRTPWKGVLLYGPPGTGKTLMAKAVASRAGLKFVSVSAADLMSKYQGESEKMVRAIMEEARRRKPCVVFIDEIDSIGRSRKEGERDCTRRMKNELLKQLDGVGTSNNGVVLLGATNAPWEIDAALRRRFEKRVYVALPDSDAREKIFRLHLDGEPSTVDTRCFRRLARATTGYSGSDIAYLCREALMEPVRELMQATHFKRVNVRDARGGVSTVKYAPTRSGVRGAVKTSMFRLGKEGKDVYCRPIALSDFSKALKRAKTTVKAKDLEQYEAFAKEFGGGALSSATGTTAAAVRDEEESVLSRLSSWLWRSADGNSRKRRTGTKKKTPKAVRAAPPPPPSPARRKRVAMSS